MNREELATEVIRSVKRMAKVWFATAMLSITAVIVSNICWMYAYSQMMEVVGEGYYISRASGSDP